MCWFMQVSRSLRTLPYVEPTLPTLALVGAPNVGKSSLVRLLSSGVPEVSCFCNCLCEWYLIPEPKLLRHTAGGSSTMLGGNLC